jgi:beta-galactosidase
VFFVGGVGHDRRFLTPGTHGIVNDMPIAGAIDQALYQSYREGAFAYTLPLPNGRYRVTLNFFEPDPKQTSGGRVFDVKAGGKTMLANIDVMAGANGAMRALSRQFTATVADDRLQLAFVPLRGEALVSSLIVVPDDASR